ncbi:MAG: hypothetical protein AAB473_01195 [Patescibacteria group bacterium]
MLDTQDIQVLREIFGEMLGKNNVILRDEMFAVRDEMIGRIDGARDEMIGRIDGTRDEMTGRIDGMKGWMETLLQKELRSVRDDIIEVINDGVLPQIDRLNIRVTRLERMQRQGSF